MLEICQEHKPARQLSGLSLAFLGDSVYELMVRQRLVESMSVPVKKLHDASVRYVSASAQSSVYNDLLPLLTEEEVDILRRGRNSDTGHQPKSATSVQYHRATAIEALFGYLYLTGHVDRANELFDYIFNSITGNYLPE